MIINRVLVGTNVAIPLARQPSYRRVCVSRVCVLLDSPKYLAVLVSKHIAPSDGAAHANIVF